MDDSIAYTLFRQSDRGAPAEAPLAIFPPHVLQLRLDHGSWWVIPNREMSGTMGMMVQCQTVVPKKPGGA